jgi:hypothetical protein
VEPEERLDEVAKAEDVEGAAKNAARDTVVGRCIPGYLWSVNREMWADGTFETLFGEN